jgi:hypothetical protein
VYKHVSFFCGMQVQSTHGATKVSASTQKNKKPFCVI